MTAFCFLFFLIYDRFSHGVRSFYMTYLWLWPFVFGFLPSLVLAWWGQGEAAADNTAGLPGKRGILRRSLRSRRDFYHYGVITLTAASLLKGIFEIAGTGSVHTTILFAVGFILLLAG